MHGAQRAEKWPGLDEAIASSYSVIPTRRDKKPAIPTWKPYQERRPTIDEILTWKSKNPPGWAIVTGKISGIVTLDFDGEPGKRTIKNLKLEPHRGTPSGGFHVDFRAPDWRVPTLNGKSKRELGKKWPGLDIRADGGYAIFTGRTDKGEYRSLRDPQPYALDVLPSDLRLFLGLERQAEEKGRNRVDAEQLIDRALTKVRTEGRNNAGFRLCAQFRDNGYLEIEAEKWMGAYASRCPDTNTKGQPELYGELEILATIREVFSRPAREPWGNSRSDRFVFVLNESGLHVRDSHGEKPTLWISPPIRVVSRARDSHGEGAAKLIRFTDWKGTDRTLLIPLSQLVGEKQEAIDRLLGMGLKPGSRRESITFLKQYLYETDPDKFVTCVNRVGWHDGAFVFPNRTIGAQPGQEEIVFMGEGAQAHKYNCAGTLEEWREKKSAHTAGETADCFSRCPARSQRRCSISLSPAEEECIWSAFLQSESRLPLWSGGPSSEEIDMIRMVI